MAALHHLPWLFTLLLALLFLQNFTSQINAEDDSPFQLVKEVCNSTMNATFCEQTLESDPRSSTAPGFVLLAKIAVDLALKHAKESTADLDGMLNSPATKPEFKPAIEQCSHSYDDMVNSYSSAALELEDNEFTTASYDVAITKDDVANCEKSLVEHGADHIDSIASMNQISKYFTSITTVVIDMLGDG